MELLLLLLVLGVVTVVGHGIWVAIAAFLRLFTGSGNNRPRHDQHDRPEKLRCIGCGTPLRERERDCPSCGLEREGWRAGQLHDLDASIRQVQGLIARGEIDETTSQQLLDLFRARGQALRGKLARQARSAEPTTSPAPPLPRPIETVRIPPLLAIPAAEQGQVLDALPMETPAQPDLAPVQSVSEMTPVQSSPGPTAPAVPIPVSPVPPPRRLANVLSAFMEERNILWGELVGGLLIVGCSIALVLTLWRDLQALPYFPFLLFTALTGSLFAAGQYTLHHWKLQSTSRGLLLIAMLLVPLNLLILADPSARGSSLDTPWIDLAVGVVAVLAFTLVVRASGRDLIGKDVLPGPIDRRWLLAFAVVGAAGSQLLTPHLLDTPDAGPPAHLLPLALLPGAFHLLACAAVLGGLTIYGGPRPLHIPQVHALLSFLGLATFALLASFVFLLTRLSDPVAGLHLFSCPLILAGVPALTSGLVIFRRLEGEHTAGPRTAGTGVALAGAGAMFAGVILAWPTPVPLLTALLLAGGVLIVAAFAARIRGPMSVPCPV